MSITLWESKIFFFFKHREDHALKGNNSFFYLKNKSKNLGNSIPIFKKRVSE
jgi:hypothetical protein